MAERRLWSQLSARLGRPLAELITIQASQGDSQRLITASVIRIRSQLASVRIPAPQLRLIEAPHIWMAAHRRGALSLAGCRTARIQAAPLRTMGRGAVRPAGGLSFRCGAPNAPSPLCSAMVCLPSCATTTCCWPLRAPTRRFSDWLLGVGTCDCSAYIYVVAYIYTPKACIRYTVLSA